MDEILRKMAVDGWWAWVILLAVVTIAYLARHRVGLAALVRRWEPWESEDSLKPYLGDGEVVRRLDGPLAITDKRILLRKTRNGVALSQGLIKEISNVDYTETWLLPGMILGAAYVVLGGFAAVLSGGEAAMAILGALIAAAGLAVMLAPVFMRPAALIITFTSGRPIVISGRWDRARLAGLLKAVSGE